MLIITFIVSTLTVCLKQKATYLSYQVLFCLFLEIRLVVQEIFHTLLDRHGNTKKLYRNCEISKDITEVGLTVEKASRQDVLFMRKVDMAQLVHYVFKEILHGILCSFTIFKDDFETLEGIRSWRG